MVIDQVEKIHGDGYMLLYVHSLSEQLKTQIRHDLAAICHGPKNVDSGLQLYIYGETVKEFWDRYKKKKYTTKMGIVGELLAHVLIKEHMDNLTPISVLFNTNERSIKKGFDLNYTEGSKLWYGEVKSGGGKKSVDSKNKTLLNRAKTGLIDYFTNASKIKSKWYSACNEVTIMFSDKKAHSIKEILDADYFDNRMLNTSSTANVILISVPFHDVTAGLVDKQVVEAYCKELSELGTFGECIVISIQKSTVKAVEDFLEEEAKMYGLETV